MKKLFALLILIATPAFAANIPPLKEKSVGLPDPALVKKVETYLSSIRTLETDFGQATSGDDLSSGKFYLQRGQNGKNGKFRWEYLKGQELLIISNGIEIIYYDHKLEEVTHIPMQYSIASFLAKDDVRLSGDVKIVSLTEDEKEIKLHITQASKPEEGSLILYFSKNPMVFTHLDALDADKNVTAVAFRNQKFNKPIDKDKFIFKDPKFYRDVWKKK